jgi:hypothetical protein
MQPEVRGSSFLPCIQLDYTWKVRTVVYIQHARNNMSRISSSSTPLLNVQRIEIYPLPGTLKTTPSPFLEFLASKKAQ